MVVPAVFDAISDFLTDHHAENVEFLAGFHPHSTFACPSRRDLNYLHAIFERRLGFVRRGQHNEDNLSVPCVCCLGQFPNSVCAFKSFCRGASWAKPRGAASVDIGYASSSYITIPKSEMNIYVLGV